jgi:multidrug transporter EmrE-like cation transporter
MSRAHVIRGAWVAWLLLLGFETLCQISLKSAGMDNPNFDFTLTAFKHVLATPWMWLAIGCYIGAFGVWMTILRKSSLSAAFATSAIVFVGVMLASWLVFGERIGFWQLVGCAIIVAGILSLGPDDANAGAG